MVTARTRSKSPDKLTVAIVNRDAGTGGIGRMVGELTAEWKGLEGLEFFHSELHQLRIPLVGEIPRTVSRPYGTQVMYLPKIVGASAVARLSSVPAVATVHDLGFIDCAMDRAHTPITSRWLVQRDVRALAHLDRIVCVSRFTRTSLLKYGPKIAPERIQVIPHGVRADLLSPSTDDQRHANRQRVAKILHGERLGSPLLLFVGDEAPRKNMPLLLEMLRALKAKFPHIQLVKVGESVIPAGRRRTLRAMQALRLERGRDVLFAGAVKDADLPAFYRAADLYVSASLYEGFGLPPLEALACGLPVVTTRLGAHPEVLGKFAWLLEPTVRAFVGAVQRELAAPQRPRERTARFLHAARYRWKDAASLYADVFEEAFRTRAVR